LPKIAEKLDPFLNDVVCSCGTGLMEIVFEPDLFDGEEAAALIKELALILQVRRQDLI
jgi:Asp-tRNA(Asn)/Glu-tRNA(Gln) amidotransferase B subunit